MDCVMRIIRIVSLRFHYNVPFLCLIHRLAHVCVCVWCVLHLQLMPMANDFFFIIPDTEQIKFSVHVEPHTAETPITSAYQLLILEIRYQSFVVVHHLCGIALRVHRDRECFSLISNAIFSLPSRFSIIDIIE